MNVTRDFLFNIALPEKTESYSPVSHKNILDATYEQLDRHNLRVTSEGFNSNKFGTEVIGYLDINHPDLNTLGMRLAFRNSYDKSMSVAFAAGSVVWICENGCVSGEIQYIRKHTGGVVQELNEKIITTINQLGEHFDKMVRHSQQLHNIEMTKEQYAELMGRLFIVDKLVTPTQLNIVSREIDTPSFEDFVDMNAWSLYNHVTYSLKEAHPLHYLEQHTGFHNFMQAEFNLV